MRHVKSSVNTELDTEAPLSDDLNASLNATTQHRMEIMQQFGDGQPYEYDRIAHEARFYMAQSTKAMLGTGKRLTTPKENELHRDLVGVIGEQSGLHTRVV